MTTRRILSFVLLFSCFAFPAFAAQQTTVNKIAAVVNGEMVSLHELRMVTAGELARKGIKPGSPEAEATQRDVLETLINNILLRQEAKRFNITVSEAEVREDMEQMISRSGLTSAQFDAELKKQRMTRATYEEQIRNNLLRQRMANFMVDRKIFVTREEVADYYEKHKSEFAGEKTASFGIMMLPDNVGPQEIYKQVTSGALSFEDAAKKYSVEGTAKQGGLVKDVPWTRMPPDMHRLLSSLKDGQISPLLKTQGGFVIIRRDAINDARPLTFQEARPRIEEKLRAPLRNERFKEYTQQLREKAVIDIRI